MHVEKISYPEWAELSESAHFCVFETNKPASFDRLDYVWVVSTDKPFAYITVREIDHETVYWQFGGAFPWARKSMLIGRAYDRVLAEQDALTKRITTRIENTNYPMLRLALSRRFVIYGTLTYQGSVLVELIREKNASI